MCRVLGKEIYDFRKINVQRESIQIDIFAVVTNCYDAQVEKSVLDM